MKCVREIPHFVEAVALVLLLIGDTSADLKDLDKKISPFLPTDPQVKEACEASSFPFSKVAKVM